MIDKLKNISLLVLLVIVLAGGYWYLTAWQHAKEKIAQAESDKAMLIQDKQQLTLKVADLTEQQQQLEQEIAMHQLTIGQFQNEIEEIQQKLLVANKQTLAQYDEQKIALQFKKTYQLDDQNIRIVRIPTVDSDWKEPALVLPVDYIKLAITAHDSKAACEQQSELKSRIIDLQQAVETLQQQNLQLERQKSQAYSEGYEKAFAMYMEINQLYIGLLKKPPQIDLAPSWWQLTLGAVGGALLCTL